MSRWFYTSNKQQKGPVSFEELRRLASEGVLRPNDLVWQEGMTDWVKAASQGLFPDDDYPSLKPVLRWEKPPEESRPATKPARYDSEQEPPRRRFRDEGLPVGIKIGMILGCTVVLLVVAGVGLHVGLASANRVPSAPGAHLGLGTFHAFLNANDPADPVTGNPAKIYTMHLQAGRSYTIDAQSEAFAAVVRIEDSNFNQIAGLNANAIGRPAQTVFNAQRTGVHRITVTSNFGGAGPFRLRIRDGAFWDNK